jgi:hypothetical protein
MGDYCDRMASAALRHVRDAVALASGGVPPSPDQAWHLIGFGPECSLKATLSAEWQGKAIGHAGGLDSRLSGWLLDLDAGARRRSAEYAVQDAIPGWTPNHRYNATGWLATTMFDLPAALAAAQGLVEARLASLWTAGDLQTEALAERR